MVALGDPRVANRLTRARGVDFDVRLKKQTGRPGMFADMAGRVEPADAFSIHLGGHRRCIQAACRAAIEPGFHEAVDDGAGGEWPLLGFWTGALAGPTGVLSGGPVLLLLILAGCVGIARFDDPIPPRDPWTRGEPASDVLARIEGAWDYGRTHGARSLLVLQGDTVVFEAYAHGHAADTPAPFWSGTKSLSCMMAMRARADGLLELDEKVADTLAAWRDVPDKEDIEVEHLLRFTSGLRTAPWRLSRDGFRPVEHQRVDDKYALALDQPSDDAPGERWVYGSVHLAVFGALLEAKLGESPLDWLRREILDPIDFRTSGWNVDPAGNPMLAYGAWTSTPELAKLGALLRDDGELDGVRVLPEGTLGACMISTDVNPAYGLVGWLNAPLGPDAEFRAGGLNQQGNVIREGGPQMYVMAGARGQRVYVIPELDWVVVQQADSNRFHDPDFAARLFGPVP